VDQVFSDDTHSQGCGRALERLVHRHRGHSAFERFSSASGKSSIFLGRIISLMFMRVNSKCAHQLRPPLGLSGSAVSKCFATALEESSHLLLTAYM
jgi:hypothetical protein